MSFARRVLTALGFAGLALACDGRDLTGTGASQLHVTATITGLDLDQDGVQIKVNGGQSLAVGVVALPVQVSAGQHTLSIHGLAENCEPVGGWTRTVAVTSGQSASVGFEVVCTATTGVVEVALIATGIDEDPDGFLVSIDQGPGQRVQGGTTARFAPIAGGARAIHVSGLAPNCVVLGPNPVQTLLASGGLTRDTIRVAISVECSPRFGNLVVITTTNGPPDPDGYLFHLDSPIAQQHAIGTNATIELNNIEVGRYDVRLVDLDGFCDHAEVPGNAVQIVGGTTVVLRYEVQCRAASGIRVHAPTTGAVTLAPYRLQVGQGDPHQIWPGSTMEFTLPEGMHQVGLTGVPAHCALTGPASRSLSTIGGATIDVYFAVACANLPNRTGADLVVTITGHEPDPAVRMVICPQEQWDCLSPVYNGLIPPDFSIQLMLPPDNYHIWYESVDPHCQAEPASFAVVQGQVNPIRIEITCAARAEFRATVTSTGTDRQEEFLLSVGNELHMLNAGVSRTIPSLEGARTIRLESLQDNCVSIGPTSQRVTLTAATSPHIQFAVTCLAWPVIEVRVTTTGPSAPASFQLALDLNWGSPGGYEHSTSITPNGGTMFRGSPGAHQVALLQVPLHCTMTSPNPVNVAATLGSVTQVNFAVVCP